MNLDDEQREIVEKVDSLLDKAHSGYGWGHFQGDAVPRVLIHYVKPHLPSTRQIVGPNVYIQDFKTEFDLMVVDSNCAAVSLTSAYPAEHIRCIIEVKRRGLWGKIDTSKGIDTFSEAAQRIRANFDKARDFIKGKNSNCKAAYITISETVSTKKESANKYGDITRERLGHYPVFILQDSRGNRLQSGEWQRFIEYVTG